MLVHRGFHDGANFGRHQLFLGLRRELGVRDFHGNNGGQTFTGVVASRRDLFLLGQSFRVDIAVERPCKRAPEAGQMGAAVTLRDIVGVAEHALLIGVVPLHRHLDDNIFTLGREIAHGLMKLRLVLVEVLDESANTALVFEHHVALARLFAQADAHA